jgi:PIN domain nuclease of toxin-antitoxin system
MPLNEPLVSTACVWEIAIKCSLGKLTAPDDLPERISDGGFGPLLVAQALIERLPIITTNAHFGEYGVKVRW